MTEVIVKIIEDDPSQHEDGVDSQTQILKDMGMSLPEIKDFIAANLPPPPTPPEERERLAALKKSDPEAYEREVNPKPVNKGLEGIKPDSRRGSLKPGDSRRGSFQRSRQGSIALGSGERRGSLRSTVAMVTDDPQHKQNVKTALEGAFDDDKLSQANGGLVNGSANGVNGIPGSTSLPAGTKVTKNPDGSVSIGDTVLPPGTTVKTNPDGSISVQGSVSPTSLPPGTKVTKNPDGSLSVGDKVLPPGTTVKTNPDGSISVQGDILGDLSPDASEEEIQSRLAAAGIDPETAKTMAGAVRGGGGLSPETRAMMEQVLA